MEVIPMLGDMKWTSPWGACVAQVVKPLTSAQVMISRFVGLSSALDSTLAIWSLLGILSLPLSLCLSFTFTVSVSLKITNKNVEIPAKNTKMRNLICQFKTKNETMSLLCVLDPWSTIIVYVQGKKFKLCSQTHSYLELRANAQAWNSILPYWL